MGVCLGKSHERESKSVQTDLNPIFGYMDGDHINSRQHNFMPGHTEFLSDNSKLRFEKIQMSNSPLKDWKHTDDFKTNHLENGITKFDQIKNVEDSTPMPSSVWPTGGIGDSNQNNFRSIKNNCSQSRLQLSKGMEKASVNFSDEDDLGIQKETDFTDINSRYDHRYNVDLFPGNTKENGIIKLNRKNGAFRPVGNKEPKRNKSVRKVANHRPKSGNNNSNNYSSNLDEKSGSNVETAKTFHSSNLLDQDSYPIQYTFYVDDNEMCTQPFYDRRMVTVAKTCRCRIYFHAKADDLEKPLYFKGKPVRPVTITSPDMACLKRCLGSIDSQFPYFNCKAFLSLSS